MSTVTSSSAHLVEGPRRQARSDATRAALLEAALAEFSAHGFEGASTRSIAERAGVHQPQINYHFASKDELWRAAVDHLFDRLDAELRLEEVLAKEPRALFAETLHRLVHAVATLPELNRIMVQEATADSDRLAWIVETHTRSRFAELTETWNALRASGDVADVDDVVAYYMIVGAASLLYVNAPEAQRLTGRRVITEELIRAHSEAMVAMFLRPARQQRRKTK